MKKVNDNAIEILDDLSDKHISLIIKYKKLYEKELILRKEGGVPSCALNLLSSYITEERNLIEQLQFIRNNLS